MPEFAQPAWLALIALAVLPVVMSIRRAGQARFRRVTAGVLRMLALAALAVALAGPLAGSKTRHTDVVFGLDLSSSIARESVAGALGHSLSPQRLGDGSQLTSASTLHLRAACVGPARYSVFL